MDSGDLASRCCTILTDQFRVNQKFDWVCIGQTVSNDKLCASYMLILRNEYDEFSRLEKADIEKSPSVICEIDKRLEKGFQHHGKGQTIDPYNATRL